MATPYIPARDADYDQWLANFSTVISANPATYGLASADATAIATAFANWHAAYLLVTQPSTKTASTVAAKDVQKASSLIVARGYAQIIQSNAGVSNSAKATAGLTVRATGRTPIPAPATSPILGLVGGTPGESTLKYADTSTPTTKAKPFGALQLELWEQIAPTGTPSIDSASFIGLYTKTPFAVDTPTGDAGKVGVFWGRWTTRTGLVGPWSAPLTITLT